MSRRSISLPPSSHQLMSCVTGLGATVVASPPVSAVLVTSLETFISAVRAGYGRGAGMRGGTGKGRREGRVDMDRMVLNKALVTMMMMTTIMTTMRRM
ncbi:hypothetical protein TrRE_jg3057, partial [Triparma retinervis]